ncbi:MAG: hypothetical protein BIFFINMI_01991 [Phycisphaerae bacterium]|nr:hypothetical protein [Phycisphaerae bacterium]
MRIPRSAMIFGCLLAVLAWTKPAPADDARPTVRLLAGFEWDEFVPQIGRDMVLGEPIDKPPEPGFRAKRYEKVTDVGPEGFQVFYPRSSRDHNGQKVVRAHATQGQFAWLCPWNAQQWQWHVTESTSKAPGAWPTHEPWYSVTDHFYQRESQLYDRNWDKLDDWSAYDRLRFDITSVGAPLTIGVRVRDGQGPPVRGKPSGLRTPAVLFDLPADKTVTVDFALADFARVCELDLHKVHRLNIRANGFPAGKPPTALYMDNLRLVAGDAEPRPAFDLVAMKGELRPFARPVDDDPPTKRDPEKLKRSAGPVEPLGPVVINPTALYAGPLGHGAGHFGRSGATYFSNSRRAVVAYDNDRLCVIIGGRTEPRGGTAGTLAIASFDGGKTWRGATAADRDKPFTVLPWYLRSGFFADRFGNLFAVGTPNCDSYNEGQDICMHRLTLTGDAWVDDRFAILHQDGYKCPYHCTALMIGTGRVWTAWGDGFGGCLARYSDDDGYTFEPCKDAAAPAPRPLRTPTLRDWTTGAQPDPAPRQVLIFPTSTVPCSTLVPWKGQVAVVGDGVWAYHDGTSWSKDEKFDGKKLGRGLISATTLGEDRLFISRSAVYNDLDKESLSDLVVADMKDGQWSFTQLEAENVSTSILTASGRAIYCFYVYKAGDAKYEVRYRRWADGKWANSVTLATEDRRLNHVAAPQYSPPDYAAVWWDQFFRNAGDPSEVKFCRVPNR